LNVCTADITLSYHMKGAHLTAENVLQPTPFPSTYSPSQHC